MDISIRKVQKLKMPFDGWRVVKDIGGGAYGSVFRAENSSGDVCALKVIPVPYTESDLSEALLANGGNREAARRSFDKLINKILEREIGTAEACAASKHVVRVYDKAVVDDPDDRAQRYVMVRMELLMDYKTKLMPPYSTQQDIIKMMRDIATALAFMEGRRIIHRDIKPANIMMDSSGAWKLTDFGEARVIQANGQNTVSRGTPYYMAPEVYKSHKYDHRADIYSLGIAAYYFLAGGSYPLATGNVGPREAWDMRMRGAVCQPIRGVSAELNRIVLKCIAYDPKDRYNSAVDLLMDLGRLGNYDRAQIKDTGAAVSPNRSSKVSAQVSVKKSKSLSAGAIVGIVLGSVFGLWFIILLIVLAIA